MEGGKKLGGMSCPQGTKYARFLNQEVTAAKKKKGRVSQKSSEEKMAKTY